MTKHDDPYGLKGNPEVQQARRIQVGRGSFDLILLVLLSLMAVAEQFGSHAPFNQPGDVLRLLLLPLLASAWVSWRRQREFTSWLLLSYFTLINLASAADDLASHRAVNAWPVFLAGFGVTALLYYAVVTATKRQK